VKKKVVYGKKKPQPKPKPAEADAQLASTSSGAAAAAETQAAAEASIAAAQVQAEEAKAQAQQVEEAQKQQEAEVRASELPCVVWMSCLKSALVFLAHSLRHWLQLNATRLHFYAQDNFVSVFSAVFLSLRPCAEATVDGKACPASPDHNVSCTHLS